MNKFLKDALIEKMGTCDVMCDCDVMCNSHDYKIGNKYATTWHIDAYGRKQDIMRVVITEDLAQELADIIEKRSYWDAMRCYEICGTINHYHIKLGMFR